MSAQPEPAAFAWQPQPGPQEFFVTSPATDVFYGGARGGGKTDALLGDWALHEQEWGRDAHGILFRRTYTELDEVIKRSQEIYPALGATYNKTDHEWTFPSGAVLRLRYLDVDEDAEKYKGFNLTWLGFDELTQWPSPEPVDKLYGSLRSAAGVRCVRRSTGNPGGPGHAWVRARYITGHEPYKPFRYQPHKDRPNLTLDAVFIPATIDDNQLLVRGDPKYEERLAASTAGNAALWRGWRYGDWDIVAGAYFDVWNADCIVLPAAFPGYLPRWVSIDWGFTHEAAAHWHVWDGKRCVTYQEFVQAGLTPIELATRIVEMSTVTVDGQAVLENIEEIDLSPDAFARRSSEKTIALEMRDVFLGAGLPAPHPADNDRVGGWMLMYRMLKDGSWKVSSTCPRLIDCMPSLVHAPPPHQEDALKVDGDDSAESARYGLKTRFGQIKEPVELRISKAMVSPLADPTSRHIEHLKASLANRHSDQPVSMGRRPFLYRRRAAQ